MYSFISSSDFALMGILEDMLALFCDHVFDCMSFFGKQYYFSTTNLEIPFLSGKHVPTTVTSITSNYYNWKL